MKIKGHGLESNFQFSKPDIEGWMSVSVNIMVPSFEGAFTCTFEITEFKVFVEVLSELKNSIGKEFETTWRNMEENVEFTFRLQKLGGLSGFYKFSPDNFSLGPTLSGEFEADQTFICGWLKQAEEVVANAS
ncbi:MAG: hypothetical protein GY936_20310 [Ignavibacteriae bacterium]|nr:hypothetical protein [Ignavibacteriota bacterium]